MQKQKCLLILGGLEPLQYPPGKLKGFDGQLKDPGLKTLLKELSTGHPGLGVITTREKVTDLSHKTGYTVKEILLEQLPDEAGLQLLESLGIKGSKKEILAVVQEYNGHALERLRNLGLLARQDRADSENPILDCHPLIREHFGQKLRQKNPEGWKTAHKRLYHYYKDLPGKELPDTLLEMEPLFAAVAHSCQAGLHQEVFENVYCKRIQRDINKVYCCKKLGAFGSDLAALSHFFEVPWSKPVQGLADGNKTDVLSWAAFYRIREEFSKAWQDLNEAKEIAELGSMKLFLADYHLEAGRLCLAEKKIPQAKNHFKTAKEMIDEMGYHRRDQEVSDSSLNC